MTEYDGPRIDIEDFDEWGNLDPHLCIKGSWEEFFEPIVPESLPAGNVRCAEMLCGFVEIEVDGGILKMRITLCDNKGINGEVLIKHWPSQSAVDTSIMIRNSILEDSRLYLDPFDILVHLETMKVSLATQLGMLLNEYAYFMCEA